MNTVRRLTQYIFRDIFRKTYQRKCISLRQHKFKCPKLVIHSFKTQLQIAIASTLIPQGKIDVEDDLRKAVEEGETAILDLMNQLQDLVITVSKDYRNCLTKQIELLKKANSTGQEVWNELPQFRTLAHELSNELNAYIVLLKTIGGMVYDQTLISSSSLQNVLNKYNELEILLQREFEQNKSKEKELLEVSIANIISDPKAK